MKLQTLQQMKIISMFQVHVGALTGRLASRYSATGQTNRRIETEPIRRRTQRAFLKSRDSTKMFRRSDFRNARSVRKEKLSWQILIAVTNQCRSNAPHPNGHENKNGNTRHAPKRKTIRSRDHED
jgi:hypothetical protein